MISLMGICRNVPPKKTLPALKFEEKQILWFVMYSFPCRIILSARAQLNPLSTSSPSKKVILVVKNSLYFCSLSPLAGEPSSTILSWIFIFVSSMDILIGSLGDDYFSVIYISTGFFNLVNSFIFSRLSSMSYIFFWVSSFLRSSKGTFFRWFILIFFIYSIFPDSFSALSLNYPHKLSNSATPWKKSSIISL